MGAVGAAVVGGLVQGIGMGVQNKRNEKAFEQGQQYQQQQYQNQMGLNLQGHGLQKEMWDYTNYGNQMKHMREAGLNPSLMYGMKGGGGVTTGSQGGGSAASAQAPSQPNVDMSTAMMGMQMQLMKAQADNLDAKTNNEKEGVAKKLDAEVKNVMQDTKFKEEMTRTQVEKTEAAHYDAVLQKLNAEWGTKYKLTPQDTIAIKTAMRLLIDAGDLVEGDLDEAIEESIEILTVGTDKTEQERLSEIKGLGGQSQRD